MNGKRNNPSPYLWLPSTYFVEGLPFMGATILSVVIYQQMGLAVSNITFLVAWLYLPWVLQPLWQPFMRQLLSQRAWVVVSELVALLTFCGLAYAIPSLIWLQGSLLCFGIMALASAAHTSALHELHAYTLESRQRPVAIAIRTVCYTLSVIFCQGVLVMVAGNLQVIYRNSIAYSWSLLCYAVAGFCLLFLLWHFLALPRGRARRPHRWLVSNVTVHEIQSGIRILTSSRRAWASLLFLLLFPVPSALMLKVALLFLLETRHAGGLGLSPQEFGLVQGTVGVFTMAVGSTLGNFVISRDGLRRWLFPMTFAVVLPVSLYIYMSAEAVSGLALISLCVALYQGFSAFGTTAYLHYLLYYSGNGSTSCRNWGLSLMSFSQMIAVMLSGSMVGTVGYTGFFTIVLMLGGVSLLVALLVRFTVLKGSC